MNKVLKILLVALLALGGLSVGAVAQAQNDAEDDISSETNQGGASASGDSVGGQVVGVVSSGDASVDATNRSEDVDVASGDAVGDNVSESFTGQLHEGGAPNELADGEISNEVNQSVNAASGDGVGGQVIGVVTSAGGSADVVAANTSEDVDVETGEAFADNFIEAFVGQFKDAGAENTIDGDIDLSGDQSATAASGDGVGGQVLGVVSAGDASVDATNESTDVDIETGEADADNDIETFVGQAKGGGANNEMEGDIDAEIDQAANAASGDGVGGQVIGVVTSAGGSADVVAANTSEDVDIETGEADADNFIGTFVGQAKDGGAPNEMDGDISLEANQSASAASGDGVGGQVLGVVSAGDASIDATNESTDVDIETGNADADNFIGSFVGQAKEGGGPNVMEGDIEAQSDQDAAASSGDAVAGQVAGVVTSAGGSADLVLANTSEDVDAESGFSDFVNEIEEFVGQQTGAD